MTLKKKHVPWNKGRKTGLVPRTAFKKGHIPWIKDKKHAKETLEKMSCASKARRRGESERQKRRKLWLGRNNPNWRGGVSLGADGNRIYHAQRRARKRKATGSHNRFDWELLKEIYNYTCPACERSEPEIVLTEDHIIPLSRGGSNWITNIQPLCGRCNFKKYNKAIHYRTAPKFSSSAGELE